ncbi:predicted protein [Streptomyces sp. C]|nr:predicted protein [Streptomyces sp. C]
MEGAEGRARVRAEAGGEVLTDRLVGGQRLRRAARRTQGPDPQHLQGLVQGLPRTQLGQLREGRRRFAQRQRRAQAAPARVHPYGLPARGLGRRVGEGGQRGAPPQRERLVVQGRRPGRVRVRRGGAREPFEAVQVDVLPLRLQLVAALHGPHGRVSQRPPQPPDQRLERGDGVGRRVGVPHLGDQHPGRDRAAGTQGEGGQERAQACSADGDGAAVVADGLGVAENRVAHRPILPGPRTPAAEPGIGFAAWFIRAPAASGRSVPCSSASSPSWR